MEKVNEKSCKNCLHKSNCLIRSATLYQLYIASGRSDELTGDVKNNFSCCRDCATWKEAEI